MGIRSYKETDLEAVMHIWLHTNITAHHFIDEAYWQKHYAFVKQVIPQAEIYVYENDEQQVVGFIGVDQQHIEGLFVSQGHQGQGIGKQLLDYVKEKKELLTLCVYEKNKQALSFYLHQGFQIVNEKKEEETQQINIFMEWHHAE